MSEQFGPVRFRVLLQGDEPVYPGWQLEMRIVEREIPGSGEVARYDMGGGIGIATVTLRLELDNPAAYMALQGMLNRADTLVLRSLFTNARGTTRGHRGEKWEHLPDTTLASLGAPRYEIGGPVEVLATFKRAFDPLTGRAER